MSKKVVFFRSSSNFSLYYNLFDMKILKNIWMKTNIALLHYTLRITFAQKYFSPIEILHDIPGQFFF